MMTSYPGATPSGSEGTAPLSDGAVNVVPADTERSYRFSDSVLVDPEDPQALLSALEKTIVLLKRQVDQQQGVPISTNKR